MILVIGNENCNKCEETKRVLNENNIPFEYNLITDLPKEIGDKYKQKAKMSKQLSYPIIIKDSNVVTLMELLLGIKKVIKRNGKIVSFDKQRIINAINKSMLESSEGIDFDLSEKISNAIEQEINEPISVERVQDQIEELLMKNGKYEVAKRYILYREERDKNRINTTNSNQLLTDEFISKYKHFPSPMNPLGNFVYYRTYSRWLPNEKRREYWWETVRRAVEYNCSLAPTTREEAEKLFDNIFNLKQFLSGRTFWVGGTPVSYKYPMSNFNCAFEVIDSVEAFKELFYLLMVGTGFGFRPLKVDVDKMPKFRTDIEIIHKDYTPVNKSEREDITSIDFTNNIARIIVGDSKEGWCQALEYYFRVLTDKDYRKISVVVFDYNNVRKKGERLIVFGGTASGHQSLKTMFTKINNIIKKAKLRENNSQYIKIKPIDCMDIANIIGENVVVGGVRRTAESCIFDLKDNDILTAKNNLYIQENGKWKENLEISHRKMSNNSIYYTEKPTREQLHWQMQQMRYTGEPAFVNAETASKRRTNFNGLNPCFEILLDSKGLCNLTTVNVYSFVRPDNSLDYEGLYEAQRLSARAGYRMTNVELELHKWDLVQKRDRLIGCSLTGWQDMIDAVQMNEKDEIELLCSLRQVTHKESEKIASELGGNVPLLSTTVKPEGTLSLLPTVSSGLHYSHSPYYVRRVRINSNDPLCKVCEELQYPVLIENGQTKENCSTKVIEFPVKSPVKKTKYDVTAIQQLENYKKFMCHYVDHNASITVTVKSHEWEEVEQWLWDNWNDVVAVSFLALDDSNYPLMPYESISKEEYEERIKQMKPFTPSLINKYEKEELDIDLGNESCESGVCPIR